MMPICIRCGRPGECYGTGLLALCRRCRRLYLRVGN